MSKGEKSFTAAADDFFGDVASQLKEVSSLDVAMIQKQTAIAELIYKCNQSIKLMREDSKKKPVAEEKSSFDDVASRMSRGKNGLS